MIKGMLISLPHYTKIIKNEYETLLRVFMLRNNGQFIVARGPQQMAPVAPKSP